MSLTRAVRRAQGRQEGQSTLEYLAVASLVIVVLGAVMLAIVPAPFVAGVRSAWS